VFSAYFLKFFILLCNSGLDSSLSIRDEDNKDFV